RDFHVTGVQTCALPIFFLQVLRCFSSLRSPPPYGGYYAFNIVGCPIRKSSDQNVCAIPRSLSQLITSFFASESLGIRHTLLVTRSEERRVGKRRSHGGR